MPLIPFQLPGGVYKNGSRYSSKGRYREANLVRWVDGKVRSIGGWERRTDIDNVPIPPVVGNDTLSSAAPRGAFSWRDNAGARYTAIGTTTNLYVMTGNGNILDITPDDFVPGRLDGGLRTGYGVGAYGRGAYGTPRTGAGLLSTPVGAWRFDAWGEDLLAAGPLGGADTLLFSWSPGDAQAETVPNAPTGFADFKVTPERIVMCVGTGSDHRGTAWSDREDRETWSPSATNQAGSQPLKGLSSLMAIVPIGNDHLILGEKDAYVASYLGPPYIYGFRKVGDDCGCRSANSVVAISGSVIWPSQRGFYGYDGSVKPLPCELGDFYEQDAVTNEISKTYGVHISAYNEIWWLYQGPHTGPTEDFVGDTGLELMAANFEDMTALEDLLADFDDGEGLRPLEAYFGLTDVELELSDDVNKYISYNYRTGEWMEGTINRCVAVDAGVTRSVVMLDRRGTLYNHELNGVLTGTATPYAITGPIEIGVGDQSMYIDYIYPDCNIPAGVDYRLRTRDMPNTTERVSPLYPAAHPIMTRARGREVELEIRGNGTAGWQVGVPRINVKPGGMK